MNLEDIATYLESVDSLKLLKSKNLFVNELPDSCKRGVLLMNRQGSPIDHELPGYFSTEFMVVIRSVEYKDGADLARAVLKSMTSYQEFITGNTLVKQMLPQATPRDYRRQVSGYWEFEFDVSIFCVVTA